MMGGGSENRQLYMSVAIDGLDYLECVQLAEAAERACLHAILVPDSSMSPKPLDATGLIGQRGSANGDAASSAVLEPFTLLAALSASTSTIGLIAEIHTAFHEPFHAARKLAALDYMSGGRAGCLVLPGQENAAANFARTDQLQMRQPCYEAAAAAEFGEALRQLWDSWDDDALMYDKQAGLQFDEAKVREVHYAGRYYSTRGPLNIARPPQGYPPLVARIREQADKLAAASGADVIIIEPQSLEEAAELGCELRELLRQQGRQPEQCRILASVTPLVQSSANNHAECSLQMGGGFEGGAIEVQHSREGNVQQLAEWMRKWQLSGAVDGFHMELLPHAALDSFRYVEERLIPELQKRGIFRQAAIDGGTLRDQLALPRPINSFHAMR
ncbi:LLM class flavin-dependent oxidoreductase [Paenibacillus sp. FSL H8-0537]|uniref:LLM class flavin-dependent oxidoreductase n=1 Tax=Paenibacillus sp. FSL H8-0537 TaxID=2921399 RepID=UPI00310108FB